MFHFTINTTNYEVAEYLGGWSWFDSTRDEESPSFFATAQEAQQDAINWESGRARREEEAEEEEDEKMAAINSRGIFRKPLTPW